MRLGRSFRSSSCSSPPAPASAAGPTFNVTLKGSFKGAPVSGDVQFGNLISRRWAAGVAAALERRQKLVRWLGIEPTPE